jgi:glycosyltransferase involved in cell wall biosynthesis
MSPLVSAILVTRDRPGFVRQALRCFAAQTYPNREMLVVDDGAVSVKALCAGVPRVRYHRLLTATSTGTKLNLGIALAGGSILQKWDDDDFYGRQFLSLGVKHLLADGRRRTLVTWCCFAVAIAGDPKLYFSGHGWNTGGAMCFHRSLWEEGPFRDYYASSDSCFIRDHRPRIVRVCAPEQYVVVRHGQNTWQRLEDQDSIEGYFRRCRFPKSLGSVVGRDHLAFYRALMKGPARFDART